MSFIEFIAWLIDSTLTAVCMGLLTAAIAFSFCAGVHLYITYMIGG